jgi:2-iminobutanoate/2-iminopropanoate deaminase
MKTISSPDAPTALGPYSQAIIHNGVVYCSGQIGLLPNGQWAGDDASSQAKQVLANLAAVLLAASSRPENVIRSTVFLASMDDFSAVNEVYADFFGSHRPARACIEAKRLPKDALVEISVIATTDAE